MNAGKQRLWRQMWDTRRGTNNQQQITGGSLSESRRLRASPSIESYWLRCASSPITMMLRPLDNSGAFPPFD